MTLPTLLMVEDEMYLAMMLEDLLTDAGYEVFRAARLQEALDVIGSEHIDAAILDVNLNGVQIYPVADQLRERGVPFMFASAYGRSGVSDEYREYPILSKPYLARDVVPAVQAILPAALDSNLTH